MNVKDYWDSIRWDALQPFALSIPMVLSLLMLLGIVATVIALGRGDDYNPSIPNRLWTLTASVTGFGLVIFTGFAGHAGVQAAWWILVILACTLITPLAGIMYSRLQAKKDGHQA